jgi:hypothetical protein
MASSLPAAQPELQAANYSSLAANFLSPGTFYDDSTAKSSLTDPHKAGHSAGGKLLAATISILAATA